MRRRIAVALWMFALAIFPLSSYSQVFVPGGGVTSHGIPGSVTSPTPGGRLTGIPSSVTSPTPNPFFPGSQFVVGGHPVPGFGGHFGPGSRGIAVPPRRHRGSNFVTVPIYVPTYTYPYAYYPYQPEEAGDVVDDSASAIPVQPEPPARTIFERRPTSIPADAQTDNTGDSRYGEHYLDSREASQSQAAPAVSASVQANKPDINDNLPNTVLVFRDGRRAEVRDYAIVGGNLYELGTAHVMKKIPLAMLDLEATRKENERNGVDFHLP